MRTHVRIHRPFLAACGLVLLACLITPFAQAAPPDIRENLRALHQANHPWAAAVIANADRKDKVYADIGQNDTIAYVMTGERKYLDDAVPKLLAMLTVDPLPAANNVREYFAEVSMLYRWLRPDLTAEQNAEFEKRLKRWCEFCCAVDMPGKYIGGWNYADSDATCGYYLGLLLCDQTFGWEWTKRPDAIKAREAIRDYVAKSKGGQWIESGAYNLGTLQFVLIGAHAAGIENFPEIEALVPDIVEQQLAVLTPDYKAAYQWGDEEEPRGLHLHRRISLFGILIGLTEDVRLQAALDAIMVGKDFKSQAHLSWRALYFYQPPKPPKVENGFLRVAEGNGHFVYKREGAALYVHFPNRLNVQHEVSYTCDVQLYVDGEWVLSRPLGYAGAAVTGEAGNSPLFAGLSSMNIRGTVTWQETTDGCAIKGGTFGPHYGLPYYDPPPAFAEFSRQLEYRFPAKLKVTDRFKGDKPKRVDRYRAPDQALIKASPLWQQVWHCPVEPTETADGFTWKTAGGKTITLAAPKGCQRVVIDEREKWKTATTNFKPSELKWQIRFSSDEPACEMVTVFEAK